MTMFRPAIAAAVALFACVSTPAAAQDDRIQVRISYVGLDLDTAAGRKTLQDRIDRTVRRACAATLTGSRLTVDQSRCRNEMLRDADVQVAAIPKREPVKLAARR